MCYPSPGPRCSAHAALALTKAKVRARTERSLEAREALDATQLEYDATPAGMRELRRRINQYDGTERTEYELRLALGQAKRAERLRAIKTDDRGDLRHSPPESAKETAFPAPFHQFTDDYENEPRISPGTPEMDSLIADSHQWMNQLDDEEIEAVSWYTSNGSFAINKHLTGNDEEFYLDDYRDGETPDEFEAREAAAAQAHQDHLDATVTLLDSALRKGKRTTPIKLYRGISADVLEAEGYRYGDAEKYVAEKFQPGQKFTSPVFMSSSLEYKGGFGFTSGGVLLEVLGKTVGPVSNVSAWSTSEKEYILPRNTPYTVKAVKTTQSKHGRTITVVQLEED